MPPIESLRQVEAEIRASIERSFEALREELGKRLRSSSDEAVAAFEAERDAARLGVQAGLLAGVARIDGARSQGDVLTALLQTARAGAGRAAVLLAERAGARLWAAEGFDRGGTEGTLIAWSINPRWSQLSEGRGAVLLSAADCAPLIESLEAALPSDGALVPLVLRDQLAAVLYVDRRAGERSITLPALQVLTYVAALALETLPFREREATPTLSSATASGAGLSIWGMREVAEPRAVPEPAAAPTPPPAEPVYGPVTMSVPIQPPAAGTEGRRDEVEELLFGDAAPPPRAASPARPAFLPPPPAEFPEIDSLPELILEPLPEFESDDLESSASPRAPEPQRPLPSPPPLTGASTLRVPVSPHLGAGPVPTAPREVDLSEEDTLLLQRSRAEERARTPQAAATTTNINLTSPVPAPWVPPAPPPAQPAPPSARATAEVHPPADVRGPGRAFAGRPPGPGFQGPEASHEEARRLAKLLVSEIKLYNEDQIEAGRRGADIYTRLREDIERSRQMYEERVDPRVRAQNDYFQQELVRILAGGDARALGF